MQEAFMRRAIEIAAESIDTPGTLPFGAVVVRDGEIIGEGLNRSFADSDPTSHGEVEAIRDACRRLGVTDLAGADLYTSCEPCAMCVATMYQAGIVRLYYAGVASDSAALFERLAAHDPKWARKMSAAELRHEVGQPMDARAMPATRMLAEAAQEVFDRFLARHLDA
ncbi:MAG: nucleoside deaminase [Alphaproteobacteria bacterium]|jgi:tRNA(Arg) A34 adenosine deaminase TadA|nr:nucleoside deaminase [Alphaproteobacteria bacterium]